MLRGIRDSESRMAMLGFPVPSFALPSIYIRLLSWLPWVVFSLPILPG
jgi:hypothetical protein